MAKVESPQKAPSPVSPTGPGHRTIKAQRIDLPPAPGEDGPPRKVSGDQLGHALKPVIEEVILDTLRENPKVVVDIVYPVLGRAIRKAIAGALQGLVESIENQAASVFSAERLKWRWQAFTTKRSYAEIVLAHSVLYSVDEVLLIHRETGLLLLHASRDPDRAKDADLVSSMLTAIEDFARDSFDLDDGDALSQFTMSNQTILICTSPSMVLAAAVEGNPVQKVTDHLDETLEDIHRDYRQQLDDFTQSGDIRPFVPLLPKLEACLIREMGSLANTTPR